MLSSLRKKTATISVAVLSLGFKTVFSSAEKPVLSVSYSPLVELNVFIRALIVRRKRITVFCGSDGIGNKMILGFYMIPVFGS